MSAVAITQFYRGNMRYILGLLENATVFDSFKQTIYNWFEIVPSYTEVPY